jgi:hypothetical protein
MRRGSSQKQYEVVVMNSIKTALIGMALITAPMAMADHNSIWGEGLANMPNDIHNTRIETMDSEDSSAFIDFVSQGAGADSVNDAQSISAGGGGGGMGGGGMGGGRG